MLDGGRDGDRDGNRDGDRDGERNKLVRKRLKLRHIIVFCRYQTQPRIAPIVTFGSRFIEVKKILNNLTRAHSALEEASLCATTLRFKAP